MSDKHLKPKKPRRADGRRGFLSRTLWVEIVFFVAMAGLGFALVATLVGGQGEPIVRFVPDLISKDAPAIEARGLYEAESNRPLPELALSPIFTPSVQYWEDEILAWAEEASVDPNLVATVMQIESCGAPEVSSFAGAMGLFQVMPFHFEEDEDPFDPDTNAYRGMLYLSRGLDVSGGHAGLAMAGYNGGHGVISRSYENWPTETQRYYRWGSGIYREASAGWDSSPTLAAWLAAGGQGLCAQAEEQLGL